MANKEIEQLEILHKEMLDKMIATKSELMPLFQELSIALLTMQSDQIMAMPQKTLRQILIAFTFAMATVAREERIRRDSELA